MQGNAIPNVLFIYNDEYSCLCLDANNNEWMDFFVFLVLNLLVKIQFGCRLHHELLLLQRVPLAYVNFAGFVVVVVVLLLL